MNANAVLWVEALRSGKFQQTRLVLERDGKQCCLGVACRVAMEHGVKLVVGANYPHISTTPWTGVTTFNGLASDLPRSVTEWLGLNNEIGRYRDCTGEIRSLAGDNDNNMTFVQIADIIESEPDGLFKAA